MYFVVFQLKRVNSTAVFLSLSLSLSLSHARTHTEGVCVNAAVLVGDYLLTFRGSLLPPFSWCLQAKIPPEVECGKLSETFLAVY